MISRKEICILGGTGSLGKTLLYDIIKNYEPKGIRIFSRDELKQWQLKKELSESNIDSKNVAFLIGDVRDKERLKRAFTGVDIVINTAAMKHIGSCENDPLEAVKTNINGAVNIIDAALDCDVEKVLHVSTDKAVYPINLYGATKAVAEKLFTDANIYRGSNHKTKFCCVRYGNVLGSRGSIIPFFNDLYKKNLPLPITDERMTRFFISLQDVSKFILDIVCDDIVAGEIHVPKMKAIKITNLVKMLWPEAKTEIIGMRAGEKIHEVLIAKEECRFVKSLENRFVIMKEEQNNKVNVIASNTCLYEINKKDISDEFYV